MKKNLLLVALLVSFCAAPVFAQTKKNANSLPPVNAFFSNETGKSPEIKRPAEETFGIWNEFNSDNHGFTILFPAEPAEISVTERDKIASFETKTERASYGVMRMKFPALLDNRQLRILGESLFAQSYDRKTTRLISEKNVCLDGMPGKELIYEEAGKMFFTRFYVVEQKIFMLSVSLPQAEYTKDFDYWAMKFLDSFGAKKSAKFAG